MVAPSGQSPRIISFLQLCQEADPEYWDERNQPEQYEFSNGRVFYHPLPFYDFWEFRLDDPNQGILDVNQLG